MGSKISKTRAIEMVVEAARGVDSILGIYVNDDGGADAMGVCFNDVAMSQKVDAAVNLACALAQLDDALGVGSKKKKAKKKKS